MDLAAFTSTHRTHLRNHLCRHRRIPHGRIHHPIKFMFEYQTKEEVLDTKTIWYASR